MQNMVFTLILNTLSSSAFTV